jgi:hypothetical protein
MTKSHPDQMETAMHPEILAQRIRDHHDDLRRAADAERLVSEARRARNPHIDEPRARRRPLIRRVVARLASA